MNRRDFLLQTGAAAAALVLSGCAEAPRVSVANNLSIVVDLSDAMAVAPPVRRATDQLRRTLMTRGFVVLMCSRLSEAGSEDLCLVVAGAASPLAREFDVTVPEAPGALAIAPGRLNGHEVLLACGRDELGLVQALTEISEALARAQNPAAALRPAHARDPSGVFGAPSAPVAPHDSAPSPRPHGTGAK